MDYSPLPYTIPYLDLDFHLDPDSTQVRSRFKIVSNPILEQYPFNSGTDSRRDIVLDGVELQLDSITMDGKILQEGEYQLTSESLVIPNAWDGRERNFEIITRISPSRNTELLGLYRSSGIYCTQNEPEGFRRITYYTDRPDVLSTYRVRIQSPRDIQYLLANGNRVESGTMENGDRYAIWEDPFPKPSYLFALVAGNLEKVEDQFVTGTGRTISLEIYTNQGKSQYASFAMESLKLAMRWDEDVFHREYDLDLYMIVAVDDFNMGAMENKGLNVFNSKLVLASPETATDSVFEDILSVIAHEYFHNWSGNRVTLRDWFQLTLKEGLTVFRDQLFSEDMIGSVKRIDDVEFLRNYQFPEDQGKLSHPIQPKEYLDIDNFYTRTVYEKGAEVIRMVYTIAGRDGFIRCLDEYFRRFDGMAVTTEDFLQVFEEGGYDLSVFKNWYDRKGTPKIGIRDEFLEDESTYRIFWKDDSFEESKIPLHYPVRYTLHTTNIEKNSIIESGMVHWKGRSGEMSFSGLKSRPVLSLFQEFSSPVELNWTRPYSDLFYLWLYDSDPFTRQNCGFQVKLGYINDVMRANVGSQESISLDSIIDAYKQLLNDLPEGWQDLRFLSYLIRVPGITSVTNLQDTYDMHGTHRAIRNLMDTLQGNLKNLWMDVYSISSKRLEDVSLNRLEASGIRFFRNEVLEFLDDEGIVYKQFSNAKNMTDRIAALRVLSHGNSSLYHKSLDEFAGDWKSNPLVMDYWLSIQGSSTTPDCFARVRDLKNSDYFDIRNPNRVLSLLGSFTRNRLRFHDNSGEPYVWIADCILELDEINPQSASRLAKAFSDLGKLPADNQKKAKEALQVVRSQKNLSNLVYEVVESILS